MLKSKPPNTVKAVLTTAEAAIYLSLSESYLEKARLRGNGPPFLRLTGTRVGYLKDRLDAWLAVRADFFDHTQEAV